MDRYPGPNEYDIGDALNYLTKYHAKYPHHLVGTVSGEQIHALSRVARGLGTPRNVARVYPLTTQVCQSVVPEAYYVFRGRDPLKDAESPFAGFHFRLPSPSVIIDGDVYKAYEDPVNGWDLDSVRDSFDLTLTRHFEQMRNTQSSVFHVNIFRDDSPSPRIARRDVWFDVAMDETEAAPCSNDSKNWGKDNVVYIPSFLTSIFTLRDLGLNCDPYGLASRPVHLDILLDSLATKVDVLVDYKKVPLAEAVDLVYDASRATGVGLWTMKPSTSVMGGSHWRLSEDAWTVAGLHMTGRATTKQKTAFAMTMLGGLTNNCLCCLESRIGECNLRSVPRGQPCRPCWTSRKPCDVVNLSSFCTDNDACSSSLHKVLPPSILPMLDDLHLAKSFARTLRSWWVSWGQGYNVSPLNWLGHLSALVAGYTPVQVSKQVQDALTPFRVHTPCMQHQRSVSGHCSSDMQGAVARGGMVLTPMSPQHETLISSHPVGQAKAVAGCVPLSWSSVLGGTVWNSPASTFLMTSPTPLGETQAQKARVIPVTVSSSNGSMVPARLEAVVDLGSDRALPATIGFLHSHGIVTAKRCKIGKEEQVVLTKRPTAHSLGLTAVLDGTATCRNEPPTTMQSPPVVGNVTRPTASRVVKSAVGHSELARCVHDVYVLDDAGTLRVTVLHEHPHCFKTSSSLPATAWSPDKFADCPLNSHKVLNTPYETRATKHDRGAPDGATINLLSRWPSEQVPRANGVMVVARGVRHFSVVPKLGCPVGYSVVIVDDDGVVARLPEDMIFCDRGAMSGLTPEECLARHSALWQHHDTETPTVVANGFMAVRESMEPQQASDGSLIANSARRLRVDKVLSTLPTTAWSEGRVYQLRLEDASQPVVVHAIANLGSTVCGIVATETHSYLAMLNLGMGWMRLSRHCQYDELIGQDKLFGCVANLAFPSAPLPLSSSGHGLSMVQAGASFCISVCSCETCGISEVAAWRAAWPSCNGSKPTLVYLSSVDAVVESMNVLNSYLFAQGLLGPDSKVPKQDGGSADSIVATEQVLSHVTPPADPFGGTFAHNGDKGHFTSPLAYGLSLNAHTLKTMRSPGALSTDGYAAVNVPNVHDANVLKTSRSRSSDVRNFKTLNVEGKFGNAKKNGDGRFRGHAATSLAGGIRKEQWSSVQRQKSAASYARLVMEVARLGPEHAKTRIRTEPRINHVRARTRKGRKTVYEDAAVKDNVLTGPGELELAPFEADWSPLVLSLPPLPSTEPRPVQGRPLPPADEYLDADQVVEDNVQDGDGSRRVSAPRITPEQLQNLSDASITAAPRTGHRWQRARELLATRIENGKMSAQVVSRRDHRKSCITNAQAKQAKASGGRAALRAPTTNDAVPSSADQPGLVRMCGSLVQ